jgi:hypothetical protein
MTLADLVAQRTASAAALEPGVSLSANMNSEEG